MNIKIEHIVIGVLLLAIMGVITLPGFQEPAAVGVTTTPKVTLTCDSTVTPSIDINAYDKDNPTTAMTDAYMSYKKVAPSEGAWTTWTLGTALTDVLDFGATYEFYMPLDPTIGNSDAEPFCKFISWTVPCRELTEMKIYCVNDETYDGLTNASFNADGTANTFEDFADGDVQTVSIQLKAGTDQYYGHPYLTSYPMLSDNGNHRRQYPNILCLKLNSTAWDVPQEVYLDTGEEMNRLPAPTIASADGATTHIMYCYEAPVITDRQRRIYLTLDADNTNSAEGAEDTLAYLYAGNMYINTDTGMLEWGVENNEASYTAGNADADQITIQVN